MCHGFSVTSLSGQMRNDSAIEDAQRPAHDIWAAGKQKAQRKLYAEHPLTYGLFGKNIHQQGGAFDHTPAMEQPLLSGIYDLNRYHNH